MSKTEDLHQLNAQSMSFSKNLRRCSAGFSLINVMMGIAILSIVGMTSAHLVTRTKKAEVEGESLYHLNQGHILALQKSKSISTLKAALGITPNSPTGQCLAGRGTSCPSLSVASWSAVPGMATSITDLGGRQITTDVEYKLECTNPTACEALVIQVDSNLSLGSTVLYNRHSEVRLGGIFLADRRAIDFSCVSATGGLLTAMNMTTLHGECLPLPAAAPCPSLRPLTLYRVGGYPNCQPATTMSCATGFKSVGILSGQGVCI